MPLGGVIISEPIAATFAERVFPGGLTYSGHPLACAAAVATINAMRDEGIVENAARIGERCSGPGLRDLAERHPSIGEVRGLGVFWALDLVRDRATREMLVPYNAAGEANAPMAELVAACKERGLCRSSTSTGCTSCRPARSPTRRPRRASRSWTRRCPWRTRTPSRERALASAPMSYDIFFVRRDPGQTFEDALDGLEASFEDGDPGELTEVDLEHWDALLPRGAEDPR